MTVVAGLDPEIRALLDRDSPWHWGLPLDAFAAERLHPDDLQAIVRAVRVQSPWLTAEETAEYLRCSMSRVRQLTMMHLIPHEHDGRAVRYHRDQLDAYVRDGGASL